MLSRYPVVLHQNHANSKQIVMQKFVKVVEVTESFSWQDLIFVNFPSHVVSNEKRVARAAQPHVNCTQIVICFKHKKKVSINFPEYIYNIARILECVLP